mmetsp:Transcript_15769/g.37678  ORF Transcript_15769/g.37678 Transcript_15769/m.37678 type:complete len:349 (-) Transcript_15769:826-1872(-)
MPSAARCGVSPSACLSWASPLPRTVTMPYAASLLAANPSPSPPPPPSSPPSVPASRGSEASVPAHVLEPRGHLLARLHQDLLQILREPRVLGRDEGRSVPIVARAPGTADAMHVVLDLVRHVVVDHHRHIRDVDAARAHVRRHQHLLLARPERPQRRLSLRLRPVAVNRNRREALAVEELLQHVCLALRGNEHQHALPLHALRHEHVDEQVRLLLVVARVDDALHDRVRRRADAPHRQRHKVAPEEVLRQPLHLLGESRREEERLPDVRERHVRALDDAANLGLETHVKHAISLVEREEHHVRQLDLAALHEVDESARRSHDQIRSHLNSPEQDPRGGGGRRRSKEES